MVPPLSVFGRLPPVTQATINWTVSQQTVDGSLSDADGSHHADITGDGNEDILVSAGTYGGVYWYENPGDPTGTWTQHTIVASGTYSDVEFVRGADVDNDGQVEVMIMDQTGDTLEVAKQDTTDPTGSWSRTTLDTPAWGQWGHFEDIDDDGTIDFVYTYMGASSGQGGVYWLQYNGSDPTVASNWTKYEIVQDEGAARPAAIYRDWSGDGNATDMVVPTLAADGRNPGATDGGVYWLEKPADPTTPWTQYTIDTSRRGKHLIPLDATGDGDDRDLIMPGYKASDGAKTVTRYLYDGGAWTQEDIISGTQYYSVRPVDVSAATGDDFVAANQSGTQLELHIRDDATDSWSVADSVAAGKADNELSAFDFDGDGTADVLYTAANDNTVAWLQLSK